jgi:hypothetical protein
MPLSSVVGAQSIVKPGVCTSTTKPASPFDGQVIYMTDVDQTAVWDGSQWTVLAPIASGRNVVINGAMQVHQRGTSVASIAGNSYNTADRWNTAITNMGVWTQSVENDAPTGSGFRKSLKMLCTTADASPAVADEVSVTQIIEGQNLQQFLKGTSSAKQFTLSFWVKANVTGTYVVWLYDPDNTRHTSLSYTISASATWEKKTIIFAADTTGAFENDNGSSLFVRFYLGAGSDYTSGTLASTWASLTNANRCPGQTNLAAATSNYWQVTGVQLEAGAVATPFEFEDYSQTLRKCQRYYNKVASILYSSGRGVTGTGRNSFTYDFPVRMRTAATVLSFADGAGTANRATYHSANLGNGANHGLTINASIASDSRFFIVTDSYSGFDFYIQNLELSAEL